ncbi:DUF998 domain-containing protein [Maribacter hydrothermalis]|uniref:DUF998 domain-containing protein n=1 Tax=Maribacter hydrothermalis TaxID=1836467 RepID=A0A1B7Z7L3_9FLAO|nr:DUF998 domain-containing protein [Maribacter hydrothermalis]APQ15927.1 hypothetical protein BTR34_00580 [Maribacter hydrothermalis]OBR38694.1 hypothetical protein A9200_03230 [Maribacter hydrothermalis]
MTNRLVAYTGILGVSLFAIAAIVGPLLIDDYSEVSQFISESFASDTEYGGYLQYFGYVPSGILTAIFSFSAPRYLPNSRMIKAGFFGLAIFYGLGTLLVGLFPCDAGCPTNLMVSSTSQLIHNAVASLTYIFFPVCLLGIGLGLKKFESYGHLSQIAITTAIISGVFIFALFSNPDSGYRGILQRIIETSFIIFLVSSALRVGKSTA